jgi:hypothetical protein
MPDRTVRSHLTARSHLLGFCWEDRPEGDGFTGMDVTASQSALHVHCSRGPQNLPLIAGGSDADDLDMQQQDDVRLAANVLSKLAAGRLPNVPVSRLWVGDGMGAPCDACDRPILPTAVEYEMNTNGQRALRFHRNCFVTWQRERAWYQATKRNPAFQGVPSDAAPVVQMITDTAMCLSCISKKSGLSTEQTNAILRSIAGTMRLSIGMRQCAVCMAKKTAFGIRSRQADGPTRSAILSFLAEHRGEAFCSRCISSRLFAGRHIDVTLRHLEGSPGVIRRHGRCSQCRLTRLVTSLS